MGCTHSNKNTCGCTDKALTTSSNYTYGGENCPNGEECEELYNALCIEYTGDDIECNGTVLWTTGERLPVFLENFVGYFCELAHPNITAQNIGTGEGEVFESKDDLNNIFYFRTIKSGTGITITQSATEILIDADTITTGDITCGVDTVTTAGRTLQEALDDTSIYFCNRFNTLIDNNNYISDISLAGDIITITNDGAVGSPAFGGTVDLSSYNNNIYLNDSTIVDPLRTVNINTGELLFTNGQVTIKGKSNLSTEYSLKTFNFSNNELIVLANNGNLKSSLVNNSYTEWKEISYLYDGVSNRNSGTFTIYGSSINAAIDTLDSNLLFIRNSNGGTVQHQKLIVKDSGSFWSASFNSVSTHTVGLSSFDARHRVFNLRSRVTSINDNYTDQGYTYFYAKDNDNLGGRTGIVGIGINEYSSEWNNDSKLNLGMFTFSTVRDQSTGLHVNEITDTYSVISNDKVIDFTLIKASKTRGTLENTGTGAARVRLLGLDVDVSGGVVDHRVAALFDGGYVGIGLTNGLTAVQKRGTDPLAMLHIKGSDATSGNHALIVQNSVSYNAFNVRNDGNVGINIANSGRLLQIQSSVSNSIVMSIKGTIGGGEIIQLRENSQGDGYFIIADHDFIGRFLFNSNNTGFGDVDEWTDSFFQMTSHDDSQSKTRSFYVSSKVTATSTDSIDGKFTIGTTTTNEMLSISGTGDIILSPVSSYAGGAGNVFLNNIPTSDPLIVGALWNDSGIIKISL